MKLSQIHEQKKNVLSFEIFPPKKDEELKNIDKTLEILCELQPDFISVTFGARGSAADNKTVGIARKIKDNFGVEPMVHLTCLHYSRQEISELLKQFEDAGIENILALRGDVNPNVPMKQDFHYAS